jgi:uncharacterized protein YbaP (TraB family)
MARKRGNFKSLLFAWAAAAALMQSLPAAAAGKAESPPPPAKHAESSKAPQPALWKVVNGKSIVYLFGSIHILPVNFPWHAEAVDHAMGAADSFVFEADLDYSGAEFHYYLDNFGYLPRGQTLHKLLSPAAQEQYFALIRNMHFDLNKIDYLRPGLAVLLLDRAFVPTQSSVQLGPGVDSSVVAYAKSHAKELRYLEGLQTQFDVLTALGGGEGVAVLEKKLTSRDKSSGEYQALLAAWAKGDLVKLAALEDVDGKERVLMLDNRNANWLPKVEAMLNDSKIYFVTVGAAHLTGAKSLIDLLCTRHWKVERVQTGATPPPPGCPASSS